jgi:hypothetical protein
LAEQVGGADRTAALRSLEMMNGAMLEAGVTFNDVEMRAKFVPPSPWTSLSAALRNDASAQLNLEH